MEIFFHIKLAIRSLLYNRKPAVLLCLSITTGLTAFILISGYVTWERGFDRHFPERENIYRIITDIYSEGELKMSKPQNERGLGEALKENYPEVIETGFLTGTANPQYRIGEELFRDEMVYHASAGFLDVFSIDMVQGDRGQILRAPYTAIISESAAAKYFGDADPVGETIFKYPAFDYVIEGVFEDIPGQAHISFDILLSFHDQMHLPPPVKDYWGETVFYTYLKLRPGTDAGSFEDNINELVMAHKKEHFDRNKSLHKYHLQPLNDIHLNSDFDDDLQKAVRADYLYLLLIAGFLILIAAGFNYLHFSFTNLASRSSHIGIKKVNGAGSFSLIFQGIAESVIIHAISLSAAIIISLRLIQPVYNYLGITIDLSINNHLFWLVLSGIILISILVNGIIPVYLTGRLSSIDLLQNRRNINAAGFSYRHIITTVQFAITIAIIIAVFGMNKQIGYLEGKEKGFEISNDLVIKVPQNMQRSSQRLVNLDAFEQQLMSHSLITGVTQSNRIPGEQVAMNFSFSEKGTGRSGKAGVLVAGEGFTDYFGIDILAGRFPGAYPAQNNNYCIINEACLKELGLARPEDAVGRILTLADESMMQEIEVEIASVTSDYNFESMRNIPGPVILMDWTGNMIWGNYIVKLLQPEYSAVIPFIRDLFEATFINYPFEYILLEDFYNQQFAGERQLVLLLKICMVVILAISLMNLFAMAWYVTLARTKEIGIRKVNGAKSREIVWMLNGDFLRWVVMAFLIATPIAWYAMNRWLQNFAYRTELNWWIFALAGVIALGIAMLTVSWQSWRAARRNPVESLRHE
ncbi:MAG: ABC transporter permease [Bacteroidales bacterium]